VIDVTAFSQRYQLYALIQRLSDSGYVIVNENDDKWSDFNTNVRALKGVTKKKSDLSEEFIVNAIEAIKKTVERLVVNLEIFQDETNESFLKSLEDQMLR
jgi:rubrerythrin